jgi:PEP-CTERM motif
MKLSALSLAPAILAVFTAVAPAHADTTWTSWVFPAGTNSATGTLGSIGVNYSGDLYTVNIVDLCCGEGWTPSSSYVGGPVTSVPTLSQLAVLLTGGTNVNGAPTGGTITFSSPITDPVMDIFSLGASGNTASFVFTDPFTIVAGGPSTQYGGGSIFNNGPGTVSGEEGNGAIEFLGTYSSISFTTPQFEDYYAFTVGMNADPAPEPGTLSLIGLGIAALPMLRRRFIKR